MSVCRWLFIHLRWRFILILLFFVHQFSSGPVIDCTLGLALSILGLKLLDYIANKADWVSLKHSGVYVGRRGVLHWINQMIAWLVILTVTKVIVCYVMWLTSEWLAIFSSPSRATSDSSCCL